MLKTSSLRARLKLNLRHPGLLPAKLLFRLKSLGRTPTGRIIGRIGRVRFEFDFDFDPAMTTMYRGGYEIACVRLVRKHLRPGGVFLDCGANIGYFSALALDCVGPTGQVHAFEPVPRYFERLRRVGELNPSYHFYARACALGNQAGDVDIAVTNLPNKGWNTVVPGFMDPATIGETVHAPVIRLDAYLHEQNLERVDLIKIDVEGYELPVLEGLSDFFALTTPKPPVLCEVAPAAYPLLKKTLSDLSLYMAGFGYKAFDVLPPHRPVVLEAQARTINVLFRVSD
jgi:FkbM family methyltransferase